MSGRGRARLAVGRQADCQTHKVMTAQMRAASWAMSAMAYGGVSSGLLILDPSFPVL